MQKQKQNTSLCIAEREKHQENGKSAGRESGKMVRDHREKGEVIKSYFASVITQKVKVVQPVRRCTIGSRRKMRVK